MQVYFQLPAAPALQAVSVDWGTPTAILAGRLVDRNFIEEFLSGRETRPAISIEALSGQLRSFDINLEGEHGEQGAGSVAIDPGATPRADGAVPVAWTATLNADRASGLEFGRGARGEAPGAIETASAVRADGQPLIEAEASVDGRVTVLVEIQGQQALMNDAGVSVDWLLNQRNDYQIPAEVTRALNQDELPQIERGMAAAADSLDGVEIGGGIAAANIVPIEVQGQQALTNDANVPLDWRLELQTDRLVQAESEQSVRVDDSARPIEHSLNTAADGADAVEAGSGMASSGIILVENQGAAAFFLDANMPVDWRSQLAVSGLIANDFILVVRNDPEVSAEWLASAARDISAALTFGGLLRADAQGPTEWGGTATLVFGDVEFPLEFAIALRGDTEITSELLRRLVADGRVPLERFGISVLGGITSRYLLIAASLDYVAISASFDYTIIAPARSPRADFDYQGLGVRMPQLPRLPPVAPTQVQTCAVDFGNFLPPSVTLSGPPTVTMSVHEGVDADPASRVIAGPEIGTAAPTVGGTGKANTAVLFQLADCLPGVTYVVEIVCPRSDGDVAEGWTRLACLAPS